MQMGRGQGPRPMVSRGDGKRAERSCTGHQVLMAALNVDFVCCKHELRVTIPTSIKRGRGELQERGERIPDKKQSVLWPHTNCPRQP